MKTNTPAKLTAIASFPRNHFLESAAGWVYRCPQSN